MLSGIRPPRCVALGCVVALAPGSGPLGKVDGPLPRLGGQPTLGHKEPLAYDPGMGRGKLHDGAEDCGHLGMDLFIRGRHAGLWRVRVPWPVPHVTTVLLQLNQLLVDQHTRYDRGTERLALHRGIRAGEPENMRGTGGWRLLRFEPQFFQELLDRTELHSHILSSRWVLPLPCTTIARWRPHGAQLGHRMVHAHRWERGLHVLLEQERPPPTALAHHACRRSADPPAC